MFLTHVVLSAIFLSSHATSGARISNNILVEDESHEVVRRSNDGNNEGRPQIIYVNPSNADRVISEINMPSWQVMRKRKKPFTFFVEGIVGAGKSTLLEPFKKYPMMEIYPEPVKLWTNLNGTDLLQLAFDNPYRWALTQESYVLLTMLEEHLKASSILKGMERSIHSARYCFAENFYQSGQMKQVELALLDSWYKFAINEEISGFDLDADMIFYLQADPELVFNRIKQRGRPEESKITLNYLEKLHRLHEDWLIHGNSTSNAHVPSKTVYVINANHSFDEMIIIYKKLANRFWHLIPKELKNRQCWLY